MLTLTARCPAHPILPTHHFFFRFVFCFFSPPHCVVARVGALAHGAAAVPSSSGMQPCSAAKSAGPLWNGHAAVTAPKGCDVAPVLLGTRGQWIQKDDTACAPALQHRVSLSHVPHPRPPALCLFPSAVAKLCPTPSPPHSLPISCCHSHPLFQPVSLSCPIPCPCALSPSPVLCPFPVWSLPLSHCLSYP